jgi:hypothetical protein
MLAVEKSIVLDETLPRRVTKDISSTPQFLEGQFEKLAFFGLDHE